jgi:tRNA modification GTPase
VDTAGIGAAAPDPVEALGIERSRAALAQADLALLVIEASRPPNDADRAIAALVGNRPAIVVLNKIDLVAGLPAGHLGTDGRSCLLDAPSVCLSTLTGEGMDLLEDAIVEPILSGRVTPSAPVVTNPRHKEALSRALEHVQAARQAHGAGLVADLVAIDLAAAVHALGEITGQTASDDLVSAIFGSFCVGK